MRTLVGVVCVALACGFAAAEADPSCALRVAGVEMISRVTGPGALNDTGAVCVGGTDLGILVEHRNRVWLYFGDTFEGRTPGEGGRWRYNTAAWTRDGVPANGLTLSGWATGDDGCAAQVVRDAAASQHTLIPTGGISVNGTLYLWCMSVREWGAPGEWTLNHARLYRSRDGESFERVRGVEWEGGSGFGMVAAARGSWGVRGDRHVYLLGTPGGRLGGARAARVLVSKIEDQDAYEYFAGWGADGAPRWTGREDEARVVVEPDVGEMSLFYSEDAERWGLLSFNHSRGRIELREAERPWGPWSAPQEVASAAEYPRLYGSYTCPRYVVDGGRTVYFTMSMWDPYDVYWMRLELGVGG